MVDKHAPLSAWFRDASLFASMPRKQRRLAPFPEKHDIGHVGGAGCSDKALACLVRCCGVSSRSDPARACTIPEWSSAGSFSFLEDAEAPVKPATGWPP